MLTAERRQAILDRLSTDGKVVASQLVSTLGVSEDTVRRDLRELDAQGLVRRVHGGALPPTPTVNPRFVERRKVDPAGKAAIGAAAAAELVEPGSVVLLSGGTTVLEFARRLPDDLRATVLTTGPDIAAALADHPGLEVVMIGGRVQPDTHTVIGPEAVDAVRGVRADLCVLGVCSLHPEAGLTQIDREEALVERAMIASSARVATLTGADKLGFAGPWPVAAAGEIDVLVTDAPSDVTAPYASLGIEVVRAR
jgi:DeoR/GlpR family transcriptional regulator of sugar metabolism